MQQGEGGDPLAMVIVKEFLQEGLDKALVNGTSLGKFWSFGSLKNSVDIFQAKLGS